jgi:hypothetical protein
MDSLTLRSWVLVKLKKEMACWKRGPAAISAPPSKISCSIVLWTSRTLTSPETFAGVDNALPELGLSLVGMVAVLKTRMGKIGLFFHLLGECFSKGERHSPSHE